MNAMLQKISKYAEKSFLIILLLLLWWICSKTGYLNVVLLPPPEKVFETLVKKILDASLIREIWISICRVIKGYCIASVFGIFFGIIIGLSNHMMLITDWIIQLLRPIPPIAWIPLVILWMGIGENSKVFLIFLGGFFVVLINVIDGVHNIDPKLLEVARAAETPKKKYILKLIIPAALPNIFTGLRVAMGTCWSCVVAAELVAASSGIGYMISIARNYGQMDVVIIGMTAIGITGKIMDLILKRLEHRVLFWN